MKFIRQITLFLALIVMMGHDVVPHEHDHDEAIEAGHDFTHNEENSLLGLQHALSHYQHNAVEKASELSVSAVKKADVLKKATEVSSIVPVDDGVTFYSNLKKQKFWRRHLLIATLLDTSQTLRGPPSC